MMKICSHNQCKNKAIFLKEYCWKHLAPNEKNDYGKILLNYLKGNKEVIGENFQGIMLHRIYFPDNSAFKRCNFTLASITESSFRGADFRDSVFNCATLKDCYFQNADFRGTETSLVESDLRESHFDGALLQNTDLTGADLRDAILIDADLIGAMLQDTHLYASRFNNTRLRKENFCNFEPIKSNKIKLFDETSENGNPLTPLEAKYVYSSLKNNFKSIGEYEDERWAHINERNMERHRLFRLGFLHDRNCDALALERWEKQDQNKLFESILGAKIKYLQEQIYRLLGYGESPAVFLVLSLATIFLCALLFMFSGYSYQGNTINRDLFFPLNMSSIDNFLKDFSTSLYVSIVTFSTLGYGDACPIGKTRVIACVEALLGLVFVSSFVATFLKKLIKD